ncbi:ATP-binding protein [Paracoccus sp. S3-43]|uniref:ATP-binding protein n=1 Tax=Paracoccus sp. S3-43 TaxID=3030011 RepID=UPI0023B1D824|nr:ATP-binding protein [Paracoccus sp. S3-43]WEF23030.1 ATP-binding protein [Paracoccus sp. S3-43]
MDLRQALSETAFGSPAPAADDAAQPWIAAAAVLTHFEPLTLRSDSGTLSPMSPAMVDLLDASAPSRAARHARRLRHAARRQALARLGTRRAMAAQLLLNPAPDHPTQAAFQALVQDDPSAVRRLLDSNDPVGLAALGEAAGWVEGILDGLPSARDIDDRLSRARLLAPLRRLVGEHFAGREDVLAEIAAHLDLAPEGSVLMLQGPGGVGKSTVLAKFILDAVEKSPHPPTVMVLNLDDPQLVIDDPFTLLQEAGRQLRIQHPVLNPRLDEMRDYIASLQRRSRSMDALESLSGGAVEWSAVSRIARDIMALIPGRQPVLLVIDTFEEAQTTGPSAVNRLMQLVESLRAGNPRLSVIIAGRVDEAQAPRRTLTLGALDPVAARAVLEKVAGLGPLPDDLADQIFVVARGNPLATHLAGKILAAEGPDSFRRDVDLARLIGQIRTEKVQAQLYGRVLGHIRDPQVRRLAYPGLILRRVTPGVLRHVLAGPCGVPIPDDAEAERLFDLFAAEVALAEPEPGTGALRYREDVRRVILADLRADQPDLAARVDDAAIAYYRDQDGPVARAEEIYHLLARDADAADLDARWEDGAQPYLLRSLDELPPRAQVWLANRLHLDLRPDLQDAADQRQWEQGAEQTARNLMRDDLPEQALSVLNQRAARLPGSPLYLTEAEALTMLGQSDTALHVIAEGLVSAEAAGDRLLVVNLRLLESLAREGNRSAPKAAPPMPAPPAPPAPPSRAAARRRGAGPLWPLLILALVLALLGVASLAIRPDGPSAPPEAIGGPATMSPNPPLPPSGAIVPPSAMRRQPPPPEADMATGWPEAPQSTETTPPAETRQENRLPWLLLVAALVLAGAGWFRVRAGRAEAGKAADGPPIVTIQAPAQDRQAIRHAASEAYRVATLTHNDLARLRSIASLLRLHRNATRPDGPDPAALVAEAEGIIDRIGLSALYGAPGLMRELAAELGMRNPQLLAAALRVTGAYVAVPPDPGGAGPARAAGATSDPRAQAILGDMALPEGGMVNALTLIAEADTPQRRYAMMALATDLLAAELDARRGLLPLPQDRRQPLPWRQSVGSVSDADWFQTTKAAF